MKNNSVLKICIIALTVLLQIQVYAEEAKSVLFISSYHPGFSTFFQQVDGLRALLAPEGMVLDIEFMDSKRFPGEANLNRFRSSLSFKLAGSASYDLIITGDDNAFLFALREREKLFRNTPIIFFGVNNIDLAMEMNDEPFVTGIVEQVSIKETIELMISQNSGIRRICALTDGTTSGQADLKTYLSHKDLFPGLDFRILDLRHHSWEEFSVKLKEVGSDTAVLLLSAYFDREGETRSFDESLELISSSLTVPLYHLWYHGIGDGVFGGHVISHRDQSESAASIALRVLRGEDIKGFEVVEDSPNRYVFDGEKIEHFNIDRSTIPDGSLILNEDKTFYVKYRWEIWTALSLLLLMFSLLIYFLNRLIKGKATETSLSKKVQIQSEELKQSSNQAETILTNLPVIFWAVDSEGVFLLSRGQGLSALGLKQNQVVGASVYEMYSDHPEIIENIREAFKGRNIRYTSKVGDLQYETLLMPDKSDDGTVHRLNGLSIDISERIQSEMDLEAARDEAERANRAKSEFLANMSHEIRTPMNAILGFSEVLNDQLSDNPRFREFLTGINNAGKNLLALINDILDLSKIEAGMMDIQKSPVDPSVLIEEIRQIFSLKASEKGIELETSFDPDRRDKLMLDETRIRQILFNLVGNAVKFTDKGKVVISYYSVMNDWGKLDLLLKVRDSGTGIEENELKEIFEPFRQRKKQDARVYKGTGLGLSITRRLIDMMDGKISVESVEGKGSTFTVLIPNVENVEPEMLSDNETIENRPVDIRFNGAAILVVEDVKLNRDVVKAYLNDLGLKIIEASNGEEGIAKAMKDKPDLILMDLEMPVMNGYEAAEQLKENSETSHIPIVAFTASAMKEQKEQILRHCDGYLSKPAPKRELINTIIRFLPDDLYICKSVPVEKSEPEEMKLIEGLTEMLKTKPLLVEFIESQLEPQYKLIEGTYPMDETEQYADMLIRGGKELSEPSMKSYGLLLREALETMNFDKIERLVSLTSELMGISENR